MSRITSRIRRHLADPDSDHRKIATGFLWVSLFVLVGKLAGAAKEMAIAWRYGVSETVDAYVFVFNLVNWPVSVFFSVLTVILVPLVARIRHDSPGELPRFRGELFGLTLIAGLGLGVLAWFGLPTLLRAEWVGLSDKAVAEALTMTGGLAILVPMGGLISLFSAWMLACNRHRNTLFEAIPASIILVAMLLPSGWIPEPLLWGTVAGVALHMTALAVPLRLRAELQAPAFEFSSPAWQGVWGSVGIMAIGQMLMSFTSVIDQFFAAGLGPGALSTLSYANRILALILGMGAMAISRATLPVFSAANAKNSADVNVLALRWSKWMFIVAIFMVIAVWPLIPLIVEILFERGKFQSSDSKAVTELIRYGLLQIPFYMVGLISVSVLSSQKKYAAISQIASINFLVKVALNYLLASDFGLSGLMFSTAVMHAISTSLCLIAMTMPNKGDR
jgi:peptidoglycan biosynthesis protein MviN/MurJ (putative lipid II flippase)